jgi:hypothetical protein
MMRAGPIALLRGALVVGIFLLGLAGFTGSSWWYEAVIDPLNDAPTRAQRRELFGFSRPIRGDEYRVDLPLARANQRSEPAFPLVNLDLGLGQLQRNPYDVPVLEWGVVIRPWTWPLFLDDRWSHGVRWFMREALLLAALFAWFGVIVGGRERAGARERPRLAIATLGALAVFFSSHLVWWRGHAMPQVVALAGIVVFAAGRAAGTANRRALARWLLLVCWLSACAFSAFYPPIFAPVLWIVSGSVFDVQLRARRTWLGAAAATVPVLLAIAVGAAVAIAYYAPYVAVVLESLYPGRRVTSGGEVAWQRLAAMFWPSLHAYAPPHGYEFFSGAPQVPGNVCEAAAVEVAPFFFLAAAMLVSSRVRSAAWSALREHPGLTTAVAVLAAWVFLPVPPLFGKLTLLQWTQGGRAWMPFGVGLALLTAAVLAELAARPGEQGRFAWKELLVAAVVVAGMVALGRTQLPPDGRAFWFPLILTAGLLLAGAAALNTPRGAPLLGLAWMVPLALSTARVNPLLRSRDLFHESGAHLAVADALARTPGRLVDYGTHNGATLGGFGWPVLTGVDTAPDASLWRFLERDVPGLTEETWNRYAHVRMVLPPTPTRLVQADYFIAQLSPCSARAAAVGVNHLLTTRDAVLPDACAAGFERRPVGDLSLWTRRRPVRLIGVARGARPASALGFDWSAAAGSAARVIRLRDRVVLEVPGAPGTYYAYAVNLGVLDEVVCTNASATFVDTHVVVSPLGAAQGSCELRFLGTHGAVLRLLGKRRAYSPSA